MNRSEAIDKLVEALSKAQAEYTPAKKDTANPYYNSRYADLAEIRAATMPALCKNGLSIIQVPVVDYENKQAGVEAILAHSSGQWMGSSLMLPAVMKGKDGNLRFDAQSIGAAITYASRYTYQPLAGVSAEVDDDGNSISVGSADAAKAVGERKVAEIKKKVAEVAAAKDLNVDTQGDPFSSQNGSSEIYGLLKGAKRIKLKNNKGDALALTVIDQSDKSVELFCFDNHKWENGSSMFDLLEMAADGHGQVIRGKIKSSGKFTNLTSLVALGNVTFDDDGVPVIERDPVSA